MFSCDNRLSRIAKWRCPSQWFRLSSQSESGRGKTSPQVFISLFNEINIYNIILFSNQYAIVIHSNKNLRQLGLRSLRKVKKGGVVVSGNQMLCYAESINWTGIIEDREYQKKQYIVNIGDNRMDCGLFPFSSSSVSQSSHGPIYRESGQGLRSDLWREIWMLGSGQWNVLRMSRLDLERYLRRWVPIVQWVSIVCTMVTGIDTMRTWRRNDVIDATNSVFNASDLHRSSAASVDSPGWWPTRATSASRNVPIDISPITPIVYPVIQLVSTGKRLSQNDYIHKFLRCTGDGDHLGVGGCKKCRYGQLAHDNPQHVVHYN